MSLQKSTSWFALGTLLSRISGLVRVSLVLSIFGASKSLDAFFVAFRIPNLFRDMLAEGALSNAFTKMYADCFEQSEEKAKEFFAESICLVLLAGFCVMLTGVLTAPLLVKLMTFYGEPDPEFVATATVLTRILFPFLYLMMLGSIFAGTLHHKGRFFLSSLAPLGFNFGYILGAIAFAPFFSWAFSYSPCHKRKEAKAIPRSKKGDMDRNTCCTSLSCRPYQSTCKYELRNKFRIWSYYMARKCFSAIPIANWALWRERWCRHASQTYAKHPSVQPIHWFRS